MQLTHESRIHLALLGRLGGSALPLALMEAFDVTSLSAEDRHFVCGPIVVHSGGWSPECLPDWIAPAVYQERWEIVLGLRTEWIVGPAEIVAVMMGATLAAPLHTDQSELYFWATATAMARRERADNTTPDTYYQMIGHPPIADKEVLNRGGRLYREYTQLAHEIRRKVVSHRRGGPMRKKRQVAAQ